MCLRKFTPTSRINTYGYEYQDYREKGCYDSLANAMAENIRIVFFRLEFDSDTNRNTQTHFDVI